MMTVIIALLFVVSVLGCIGEAIGDKRFPRHMVKYAVFFGFMLFLFVAVVHAQSVSLSPVAKQIFFGSTGSFTDLPLAGGKIYTYAAGTTTPLATYTDSTGLSANTNPIVLDAAGFCCGGANGLWLTNGVAYKFVVQDANGVQQYVTDNVNATSGGGAGGSVVSASINGVLNPILCGSGDFGSAVAGCIATRCAGALQCSILVPPQTSQITYTNDIFLYNNTTLECSRGGQISSGTPSVTNQVLKYMGGGTAVTLSGAGSRLIGCDFLLGSTATEGIRVSGISDHVTDVGVYGGGTSTILAHVSGSGSTEDSHIEQSRFSAFTGVGIQVDNANDTFLEHLVIYGVPYNTTGLSIVVDSNMGGLHITDVTGGFSGLHGMVVRRTLGGNYPAWIFAKAFVSDLSSSDGWLFDSSLGSANIGANFVNSWSTTNPSTGGSCVNIAGGAMITIMGGLFRTCGKSGISVSTTGQDIAIIGNQILGNNQTNAGYSGIDASNHPGAMIVEGNQIGNYPEVNGHQTYAINSTSDIEGLTFSNNNCSHNVTGCYNLPSVVSTKYTILGNVDNGGTMPADYVSGAITINGLLTVNNGAVIAGNIIGNAGNAVSLQAGPGSTNDLVVRNAANTSTTFSVTDSGVAQFYNDLGVNGGITINGIYATVHSDGTIGTGFACGGGSPSAGTACFGDGNWKVGVTTATPTVGQATCIYAAGPPVQIGKCTSVVGATGACTCAP